MCIKYLQNLKRPFIVTLFSLVALLSGVTKANTVSDYFSVPPTLTENAKPLIMLALSNDHQLFFKAFTDYDDLDGDGVIETTYNHAFEYVGYFDSFKCYEYSATNKIFAPVSVSNDKYCNSGVNNQWSGNFLNWATMTRIDEVRKVLYGGMRSTDSDTETVLERSYLPNDAHSFAKYYNGSDLGQLTPFSNLPAGLAATEETGITICNTSLNDSVKLSQNVTQPPLARVVKGNYALWAANERWQCRYSEEKSASNGNSPSVSKIYAYSSNPSTSNQAQQADGTTVGDYVVRVKVCDSAVGVDNEGCKKYPKGNYKPIGVIQRFGDSESVLWGLMTGSYGKNKSGGVLRKNISYSTDEINVDTDGTFKSINGIISTVDSFRIANYQYYDGDSGTYNDSDACKWGKNSFVNGDCSNWGNPFSEILLECYRYFAGASKTTAFESDDSVEYISSLVASPAWNNPQTNDEPCAKLNVIAFNASTVSYDGDELSGVSGLNSTKTAAELTKLVGDGEGITDNYYFVGTNGGASAAEVNQLCTAKKVTDLGAVRGTCPDSPRLEGSYNAAGIAYHANTADLRTDLTDKQNVSTYGVTLSPALPKITLTAPGGKVVTLLPACRNSSIGGNCGLVDFKIVDQQVTDSLVSGSFYVNWEDSEQGGDFDQDVVGIVKYALTSTKIEVTTEIFEESTPYKLGFGFIISGTTEDGFHSYSGVEGYTGYGCFYCQDDDAAKTKEFTLGDFKVGDNLVGLLEQPLYYAAKWGGFVDNDGDGTPNLQEEWDRKNNVSGELSPDGIPDSYFLAINPKQLQAQLTNILVSILERTASGTSASVVTNTGTGEGALYQALYNPKVNAADNLDSVDWVGTLNALFIDQWGHIREDNAAPKGKLTSADYVVDIFYDPLSRKTQIQRYNLAADGSLGSVVGAPKNIWDIQPIWGARDELAQVADYTTQRTNYSDAANTGRFILTSIDKDGDGQIGMGSAEVETFSFDSALFDPVLSQNYRLLGLKSADSAKAENIVNYIRGEAVTGFRNRRVDVDGDGTAEPILLGDIVNSSPLAVGRPSSGYDITYSDSTYRDFRQQYQNRRQVVYVGANDGMLHAFNAGFYNAQDAAYSLKLTTESEHPLGSELWAYVPYNLLPHLQWLTQPDYPHVYYVDGAIKSYDVNIFADDATHPGGWGTILIVGMRFGGGEFVLDPEEDADGDPSDDITLRSGYVVLDITDPESAPVVLAEITHEDMGYTVAEPTLVKMRAADPITGSYATPAINEWYLVMASGPAGATDTGREAALNQATSEKTAKLFIYDLKTHALQVEDTGDVNSFVGGLHTADWSRDYIDDVVYFGTVSGTVANPGGKLRRATFSKPAATLNVGLSQVLNVTNQPFSATPLTVRDRLGEYWVYVGTGRYYVVDDNYNADQQSYYGVKEPHSAGVLSGATVLTNNMVNTTDIQVFTDGTIDSKSNPGTAITVNGLAQPAKTFLDVQVAVQASDGWFFDLLRPRSRNVTKAAVSDQSLVFTEYQSSGLICEPEGFGFLNAPHLQAGIPGAFAPLGVDSSTTNADGAEAVQMSESLGLGSPSSPSIHQRGDGKKIAITQNSTGELSSTVIESGSTAGSRESWRELIINWD